MNQVEKSSIVKVNTPKKSEIFIIRILILFGVGTIGVFLWWFFSEDRIGYPYLFWPLTIALFFKFMRTLHEWYHYYHVSVPLKPSTHRTYSVDVLTTACPGEPEEMIVETLKAMQAITYPHTSYLCDEGDDPALKKICMELGVIHVTRIDKKDAKAGNINNALKQAKGEIAIVLDPDHVPIPEFIDRVLPYFEDPKIGFVQSVQAYKNRKESLVALGACEQTYHFYGPMMMAMNSYGTAQAIGANCAFRREALDSIGGHAAGLAEDMHTSMLLHSKGWTSVYIPEILTRGLVPSSLPGYYKQQLKWSRGTFDLFFKVLPGIFKNLTWRQKVHYSTIPLYFFYGVIDFMNILIPILSLVLAEFPWQVDLMEYFQMTIPILIMTMVIRQYSQRWLLEKHERGFHLVGGLLRIGTWWVFALGFIYTLFNVKVPYIPTPKEGTAENSWKLCTTNIMVCFCCLLAIVYGLYIDFNPYTIFMATLCFMNVVILGYVVIIGQQKILIRIFRGMNNSILKNYIYPARLLWWNARQGFYYFLRNSSLLIGVLTILLISSWIYYDKEEYSYSLKRKFNRSNEQFFAGVSLANSPVPQANLGFKNFNGNEGKINSINFLWGAEVKDSIINKIADKGYYPLVCLILSLESENGNAKYLQNGLMVDISKGVYDGYLNEVALNIRSVGKPVFINFAPYYDKDDSIQNPCHAEEFILAWRYIVKFLEKKAVDNVVWVWQPYQGNNIQEYFPGEDYVDWFGFNLNIASSINSFEKSYRSYRAYMQYLNFGDYPVMLIDFKLRNSDDKALMKMLLSDLKKYPEIKSIVVSEEANMTYLKNVNKTLKSNNDGRVAKNQMASMSSSLSNKDENKKRKFIRGKFGSYELLVDGKPFYIKGVSYNSSSFDVHDKIPLTRSRLKKDFIRIKEMGGNTIRRYHTGIYDRNVLNIAEEFDLKVMYGFWFDPDVDYVNDTLKLQQYYNEVEKSVVKYQKYNSVLSWTLGNDTYSNLKFYFQKPYLYYQRQAYVKFIEKLAKRIHELDPDRPVIAVLSHTNELSGAVRSFKTLAPSVDVLGVNSHDKDDLKVLHKIMEEYNSERPYLISEFSAGGYWNNEILEKRNGMLVENNDQEKANHYFWNWIKYVESQRGNNIGGVAYSWVDKPEGTATWFGLTDMKGRLKPAYYKLKRVWINPYSSQPMPWVFIQGASFIEPDKKYKFTTLEEYHADFNYEWYLQTEKKMEYVGKLEGLGEGRSVYLTLPKENSEARLYVYVSDKKGNVVTASLALRVKE
jgi:cellulose synthase/poly-beta-1,6-N-acetylglucosamine synthase-like glycosyltransferase